MEWRLRRTGMIRHLKAARSRMPVGRTAGVMRELGQQRSRRLSNQFPLPSSQSLKRRERRLRLSLRKKVIISYAVLFGAILTNIAPLPSSSTPLGAPQPTSRPRLVAKTTSSLRDSLSKTGTSGAKPAGAGPDPNQVWNRNRRMLLSSSRL